MFIQALTLALSLCSQGPSAAKPRARELGIPFQGTPGPLNAITDVAGVEVGMTTLIKGGLTTPLGKDEKPQPFGPETFKDYKAGDGPVRTGVTAIFPRGRNSKDSCFAGFYALNGNGEMTGVHWINESGFLDGPVLITNTHSVGVVRDATIAWQVKNDLIPVSNNFGGPFYFSMPVVAETADAGLNDMGGFHVKPEHAVAALDNAKSGAVREGNVGGGTGMICHHWKGGTGTASRKVGPYTVGVLLQANHGDGRKLTIGGVPMFPELVPNLYARPMPPGAGSIIVIVVTDAPLLPNQLQRLARRVPIGIGRVGGLGENSSGDLFLALSTANPGVVKAEGKTVAKLDMLLNDQIDDLFEATAQATEEAIINVLCAAEPMTGIRGFTVDALPMDKVVEILRKKGRIQ